MGRRRMREMEQTVASIQERWGPRAIRRATQVPALSEAATLSTGYAELDRLLGQGGLARGHITELVGGGTAGQMTLAAKVLTQAQAAGQQVVYVDAFQMIDLDFLARCGVHLEPLVVLRPLHWRHAVQMTGDLIRGGGAGAIVLDRLHPTLAGSAELQPLMETLPEWNAFLGRSLSTLLVISETILPEDYPYGPTLPHFSYARLGFEWRRWLYRQRRCIGFVSQITVLKNRAGPAGARREIEVAFHNGIHSEAR